MDSRIYLFHHLDQARQQMRSVLAKLDSTDLDIPGSFPRQNVAQITGLDSCVVKVLKEHIRKPKPISKFTKSYSGCYDRYVRALSIKETHQAMAEWEWTREELKEVVGSMTWDQYQQPLIYPWGERGSVLRMVATLAANEEDLAASLLSWRSTEPVQASSADPDVSFRNNLLHSRYGS